MQPVIDQMRFTRCYYRPVPMFAIKILVFPFGKIPEEIIVSTQRQGVCPCPLSNWRVFGDSGQGNFLLQQFAGHSVLASEESFNKDNFENLIVYDPVLFPATIGCRGIRIIEYLYTVLSLYDSDKSVVVFRSGLYPLIPTILIGKQINLKLDGSPKLTVTSADSCLTADFNNPFFVPPNPI